MADAMEVRSDPAPSGEGTGRLAAVGDVLLHPAVVAALVVLVVNDHVVKARWPSWASGKASDVAGLVVAPALLAALAALVAPATWRRSGRTVAAVVVGTVAAGFVAVKIWAPAAQAYEVVWGGLMWPWRMLASVAVGDGWATWAPADVVVDPTDVVALPALVVAALVVVAANRRVAGRQDAGPLAVGP